MTAPAPTADQAAATPDRDADVEVALSPGPGHPAAWWRSRGWIGIILGTVALVLTVVGAWSDLPGVPAAAYRYATAVYMVVSLWGIQAGWRSVRNAHGRTCPWCGHPKLAATVTALNHCIDALTGLVADYERLVQRNHQMIAMLLDQAATGGPDEPTRPDPTTGTP